SFNHRDADFLCCARVNRRLKDDSCTWLEVPADEFAGTNQWAEVRLVSTVYRCWHGDYYKVSFRKLFCVACTFKFCRCLELLGADFSGRIIAREVLRNLLLRKIEADGRVFLSEFDCERKTHVAEANNRDCSHQGSSVKIFYE